MGLDNAASWFLVTVLACAGLLDLYWHSTGQPTITSTFQRWGDGFPLVRWVGIGVCYHLFCGR